MAFQVKDLCTIVFVVVCSILCMTNARSIKQQNDIIPNALLKNKIAPKNWQEDSRYTFPWKGDFTYGVPKDSKCEQVIHPEHGRFVCSSGKGLNRIMCLVECMIGYEHLERSIVYICNDDGEWSDVHKRPRQKPHPQCIVSKYQ